jgi:hypothetical protein
MLGWWMFRLRFSKAAFRLQLGSKLFDGLGVRH